MADVEILTRYYVSQAGSRNTFYSGPIYQRGYGSRQRGSGVGSFLGGLFRSILPILKRGSIAAGREVLNSGAKFINDLSNNVNPRTAFKNRSKEAVTNLASKAMHGDGYKRLPNTRKRHSTKVIQSSNIKRKKLNQTKGEKKPKSKPKTAALKEKKKKPAKRKLKDIFH